MPFYERQPYIQPLHALVAEILRGDIRVPRFQRPGTEVIWQPEQRGDLLDSIYRGFPVGTILLWSTKEDIDTLATVGGFTVPPLPENRAAPMRLLLDGHQRLSTLAQILGPGLAPDLDSENLRNSSSVDIGVDEEWVFDLGAQQEPGGLSRDRFVLLKKGMKPSVLQLPLSIVLSRPQLNRWIRERDLPDTSTQLADGLRDRLREYAMPVAVLVTDSLSEATESFKRINSSGTPMGDFHMVSALAFQRTFDPQREFERGREKHLAPIGWGDVGDSEVLRVCAGLGNIHPSRLDPGPLARRLRDQPELIEDAFRAVARSARVLARVGVLGPRALPYTWQLITLAIKIREIELGCNAHERVLESVDRWFWLTTYGGAFAGVNSAVYDRASKALMALVGGGTADAMERDLTRKTGEITRFDYRSARAKACALAMANRQDGENHKGPAHKALALGVSSLQTVFGEGRRSTWWHLAIVTPETGVREMREAVRRRVESKSIPGDDALLERLGIPVDAKGTIEDVLECRRRQLVDQERRFVEKLEFEWEPLS